MGICKPGLRFYNTHTLPAKEKNVKSKLPQGLQALMGRWGLKKPGRGCVWLCRMPTAHLGQNGEDVAERVEEECKYLIIA